MDKKALGLVDKIFTKRNIKYILYFILNVIFYYFMVKWFTLEVLVVTYIAGVEARRLIGGDNV